MSAKSAFSRRQALSLFGGGAVAISTAATGPTEDIAAARSKHSQYVFGYGSLIERESRIATWPSAKLAWPAVVSGIARGWFDRTPVPSWNPTYLGAVAKPGAECSGVIFPVTAAEFASFVERETGYKPTRIDTSQVTMLDGNRAVPNGEIWYFASRERHLPSDKHPIVQSYVDVCLDGCLEIEAMYPPAKQARFAEHFIKTTTDWGPPWINDRIYPWRPFVVVPRAFAIDALIQQMLGQDIFDRITLA